MPLGDDRQRWRMTCRATLDGTELACEATTYDCWTASADKILSEAAAAGLSGEIADDRVILRWHVEESRISAASCDLRREQTFSFKPGAVAFMASSVAVGRRAAQLGGARVV